MMQGLGACKAPTCNTVSGMPVLPLSHSLPLSPTLSVTHSLSLSLSPCTVHSLVQKEQWHGQAPEMIDKFSLSGFSSH